MRNLFSYLLIVSLTLLSCSKENNHNDGLISNQKEFNEEFNVKKISTIKNFNIYDIKGMVKQKNAKMSNAEYEDVEMINFENGNISYIINTGTNENTFIYTNSTNELLSIKNISFDQSNYLDNNNCTFSISDESSNSTFIVKNGIITIVENGSSTARRYANESFGGCMTRAFGIMTSDFIGSISFAMFTGPSLATMAVYCSY